MSNIDINPDQSLVVIDATKGFTSKGTFGEAFGKKDSQPIDEAFERLQEFINCNSGILTSRCLVRSVYPIGKFVKDTKSPLYHLYVEGSNDLEDAICINGQWYTVQKKENDATTEDSFKGWINHEIIEAKKRSVLLTGCTLTTCISRTAMGMRRILDEANKEKTEIIAPLNLIGSRASHAKKADGGKSRIDRVVEEMRDNNINVVDELR